MKTPNVPQQEEPAKEVKWDKCDFCRTEWVSSMHGPICPACLKPLPIAPLLGQDEPKLENEEDLIRHERLVSLKRLVEIRSLKAELTQSLTSLAAAQKEVEDRVCRFCRTPMEEVPPAASLSEQIIEVTFSNYHNLCVRAELSEASLAEAQKIIEAMDKKLDTRLEEGYADGYDKGIEDGKKELGR